MAFPDLSRRWATPQLLPSTCKEWSVERNFHLQTPAGRLLGWEVFDQEVKVGTSMCLQQLKACKVSRRATWSSSGHLSMKRHDNLTVLPKGRDSRGSLPHASQAGAQTGSSRQAACLFPSPLLSAPTQSHRSRDRSLLHGPCVSLSVGPFPPTIPSLAAGRAKLLFVSRHHQAGLRQLLPSLLPTSAVLRLSQVPAPGDCLLFNLDSSTSRHRKFPSHLDRRARV